MEPAGLPRCGDRRGGGISLRRRIPGRRAHRHLRIRPDVRRLCGHPPVRRTTGSAGWNSSRRIFPRFTSPGTAATRRSSSSSGSSSRSGPSWIPRSTSGVPRPDRRGGAEWDPLSVVFWFLFDAMTATAGLYARAITPAARSAGHGVPASRGSHPARGDEGTLLRRHARDDHVDAEHAGLRVRDDARQGPGGQVACRKDGVAVQEVAGSGGAAPHAGGRDGDGVLSVVLALLIPSVISLWYTIGTAVVPGCWCRWSRATSSACAWDGRTALVRCSRAG